MQTGQKSDERGPKALEEFEVWEEERRGVGRE